MAGRSSELLAYLLVPGGSVPPEDMGQELGQGCDAWIRCSDGSWMVNTLIPFVKKKTMLLRGSQ